MARPRPLFQLLRPPNLFTVPGDPLCGALLVTLGAWSWRIVPAILISLAAYCAGLVINDLADYSEDLRERPSRPLPSGAVSRRLALYLALGFISVAVLIAQIAGTRIAYCTILLINCILWYNISAKKSPVLAPIAMGLCRGLSVMVGAMAIPRAGSPFIPSPMLAAAIITIYIGAVTALARHETASHRIPRLIGTLIRGLLFIQAAFCVLAGGSGYIAAVLLLALWPISRLVASRYYAS